MRKILTSLTIAMLPIFAYCQVPDFTMTSTHGETSNLHSELDSGKIVVLDFFSTTCGTCQTGVPTVEKIWNSVLKTGDNGWVWAIEISYHNDTAINEFFREYGGSFPAFSVVNDDSIINPDFGFDVPYAPQYYVVCPDYTYQNVPLNMVETQIVKCREQTGIDNNLNQLSIKTRSNSIFIDNLPLRAGRYQIRVINTMGQIIHSGMVAATSKNWQSPRLRKGVYIIQIIGANNYQVSGKVGL